MLGFYREIVSLRNEKDSHFKVRKGGYWKARWGKKLTLLTSHQRRRHFCLGHEASPTSYLQPQRPISSMYNHVAMFKSLISTLNSFTKFGVPKLLVVKLEHLFLKTSCVALKRAVVLESRQ